ncbi:hypothetical protein [Shewanella seohaensis]
MRANSVVITDSPRLNRMDLNPMRFSRTFGVHTAGFDARLSGTGFG